MMDYTRQLTICDPERVGAVHVDLLGAGGIGSMTGMLLTKLGVHDLRVFDPDAVDDVNLASQLYRRADVGRPKAVASSEIWGQFSDATVEAIPDAAEAHRLRGIVIVAVDGMAARDTIWDAVQQSPLVEWLIDGRMGAESGSIFCVRPGRLADSRWYESNLYTDNEAVDLPCTGRAVVYNTAFIGALISRLVKSIVMAQPVERRIDFHLDGGLSLFIEAPTQESEAHV